ncbi:MAG: multidrug effflux MFS transporter [Bacteroidota bacterium]
MPVNDKKNYYRIILILGLLTGLTPFSIDMYLPGFPAIADDLHTPVAKVGMSLAAFFTGICIGQLAYGPLMDRFGRKKPLVAGLCVFVLATIGCACAGSIEQLILFRFIGALGGCACMVAARAIVRDLFPVTESAKVYSMLMLVMGIAPIVAPGIGSFVVTGFNWQGIFVVLGTIALSLLLLAVFFLPESKKADPSVSLHPLKIMSQYFVVLRQPVFIVYSSVSAFSMAALFAYISSSPFIFMTLHHLTEREFGLAFGLNAFCLIAGSQVNRLLLKYKTSEWITVQATRLQFVTAFVFLAMLLSGANSLVVTFYGVSTCLFFIGLINPNASALALVRFSKNAGMAAAFAGFFQMALSAASAVCISYFYNATEAPIAVMFCICSLFSLTSLSIAASLKKTDKIAIVKEV